MNRERIGLGMVALAATVVTMAGHWPCLQNGFLHIDDYNFLEEAQQHQPVSRETVRWAFRTMYPYTYFPLGRLATALQYEWFDMRPMGYHATSLALHGLNTAMVTVLLWLLASGTSTMTSGERLSVTGGICLMFGLHPLQVEPVNLFSEQLTLISAFFALASVCTYVQAVRQPANSLWRVATVVLFAGALLSKASAVSLPLAMLALDFYPLRRHKQLGWWRLLKEKAMLIAMSAAMSILTLMAASRTGFVVGLSGLGLMERLLVAIRGSIFYLWKLVWPAWLSPWYPLQGAISLRQTEFLTAVTVFVAVIALCIWARHRAPGLLAAWLAYLALLLPVSGLVQTGGQAAADRYMYLAILPPLLVAASACLWVWRRAGTVARAALVMSLVCLVDFYAMRTREQIAVWRDDETVWRAVLQPFPRSSLANCHLAVALADRQRFDEALVYADRAAQADPGFANAHATLGLSFLKTHRFGEAAASLQAAVNLDPTLLAARYNLACAYSRLGKFDRACDTLRVLLTHEPHAAQLAVRDPELAGLRDDIEYGGRVRALLCDAMSE